MQIQIITILIILVSINPLKVTKSYMKQLVVPTCNYSYLNNTNTTPTQQNINMLGNASVYAVLAGTTTTNSGNTTIVGCLGVSPSSDIAGTVLLIGGVSHAGDAHALNAQVSLMFAYNYFAKLTRGVDLTGINLAGLTLRPGVYRFSSSAFLSVGVLTLDANGNADAEWVFQISSTLITSAFGSEVKVIGGGSPFNVYWQVGSSATIAENTLMAGNIIALTSISFGVNASLIGRAQACNGAVTMLSNLIASAPCEF